MSTFAGLQAVARKEVVHLARDRATVVFALILPLIQLVIFGFALDNNVRQIPTVVYDQRPTQRSTELLQVLRNTDTFDIKEYLQSDGEMYDALRTGRAQAAIKIPWDFADRVTERRHATVQLLVDGSDSSVSGMAINVFNAVMLLQNQRLSGAASEQAIIEGRPAVLFNPSTRSPNFFIPGLLAVLVQIMVILLVALSVVRERERGTLEQLTMTPVQPLGLMIGKMLPYAALGFIETAWILLLMRVIFDVPVHGNPLVLLLLTIPLLAAVLGVGLLISTRAKTQAEAFQLALGTMLPSIFLSGYIFPINNMPVAFQFLSRIIPTTYYIQITRGVILRGAGLADLWPQGLVLTLMGVVTVLLAARQFQKR